jgi:hypothetical protein
MYRDSAVGIATRYGLDGPGIKSLWWRNSPNLFRPTLGATQGRSEQVTAAYSVGKRPGYGVNCPLPSSAEVEQKSRAIYLLPLSAVMTGYRMNFNLLRHSTIILGI